jgi:uncharacterized protein (TIGR03492 family)
LSNGHGEDAIAIKIIEQLLNQSERLSIAALPLVGEGYAYTQLNIPLLSPVQPMPSGGFIYMEGKRLWQDLRSGLLKLTLAQYKAVRQWANKGGVILAVGDILPLLFAGLSGANYAFVGTAKSEYYLRDEEGWLADTSPLERWWGSIYYPWERWLMSRPRCKAVFPRDKITTEVLRKYQIPAFALGNPMMDGLEPQSNPVPEQFKEENRPLIILLLPGSRFPEAQRNWQMILEAIEEVSNSFSSPLIFLAAIAPFLSLEPFTQQLLKENWQQKERKSVELPIHDLKALFFTKSKTQLFLTQNAYSDYLNIADLAIAMAGTATEQFVGLGKPAIAMAGSGPQYTRQFAKNQERLLGISLRLVNNPRQVAPAMKKLLQEPDLWQLIAENGKVRLGPAGAASRIVECLKEKLILF